MSVREALKHAALALGQELEIEWIHSADLEKGRGWDQVRTCDGVVVPGGFGARGIEGKIAAARYAREGQVPYLGLCLGMQVMCIEFGRHVFNSDEANSTEFDAATKYPIIDLMHDQKSIADMGGTMRLGAYDAALAPGSRVAGIYGATAISERHRHRYEVNFAFREALEAKGLRFSGTSPDGLLPEIVEIPDHPWFIGVQYHPELKSRPFEPHPLFADFIRAAVAQSRLV